MALVYLWCIYTICQAMEFPTCNKLIIFYSIKWTWWSCCEIYKNLLKNVLIHYLVYYTCEIHQQKKTCIVLSHAWWVVGLLLQCQLHLRCCTPLLWPQPKWQLRKKINRNGHKYNMTEQQGHKTNINIGEPVSIKLSPTKHGQPWQYGVFNTFVYHDYSNR